MHISSNTYAEFKQLYSTEMCRQPFTRLYLILGETVTINGVELKDAGIYECIVSNLNGNDTKLFHLTVNGKFRIL